MNMYIDSTKRINLVSLKNMDIWPIYGPKSLLKYQLFHVRAHVFWPYLSHFLTSRVEIYYGNSRDHNLFNSVNKSRLSALCAIFDILGP